MDNSHPAYPFFCASQCWLKAGAAGQTDPRKALRRWWQSYTNACVVLTFG